MKTEDINDMLEIAAKTAMSTIPIGGTLFAEVINCLKSKALSKRLNEWKNQIEERLSKLELTVDELGDNELFTTAFLYATEQALKTSSKVKLEKLANAVYNSININIEESIVLIYLNMIEKYSELHLVILSYYNDPSKYGVDPNNYYTGSPKKPLIDTFSELKDREYIVDKIVKDLYDDGVLADFNLNVSMTGYGMVASRTTKFGKEFIDFITSE